MTEWLLKNGWTEFMDFIRHPDLDFYFAAKYKRFVLFGVPLLVRNQNEVEAIIAALDGKCLYRRDGKLTEYVEKEVDAT